MKPRQAGDEVWLTGADGAQKPVTYALRRVGPGSPECIALSDQDGKVQVGSLAGVLKADELARLLIQKGSAPGLARRTIRCSSSKSCSGEASNVPSRGSSSRSASPIVFEDGDSGMSVSWPLMRMPGLDGWVGFKTSGFFGPERLLGSMEPAHTQPQQNGPASTPSIPLRRRTLWIGTPPSGSTRRTISAPTCCLPTSVSWRAKP